MQKTQTQWSNEYNAKAYDRIPLQVKKGQRDIVRAYAQERGLSVNAYINRLIQEDMSKEDSQG